MLNRAPQYEIIGYAPSRRISCREFQEPVFQSPYHQHVEIEITAILSSTGSLHVGGEVLSFEPGECFIIGSNLPHKFHNDPNQSENQQWAHSIVLQFDPDLLKNGLLELPELEPIKRWLVRASKGLRIKGNTSDRLIKILQQMLQSRGIEQVSQVLQLFAILEDTNDAEEMIPFQHTEYDDRFTTRIALVTQYMYENLGSRIRLQDLAHVVGMNRSSFSRFFKSATGKNMVDYLHEIRFREICRLLHQTDKSITEIAFECGYENLSTFNRCFRKLGGMSPKEYRKYIQHQGLCVDL